MIQKQKKGILQDSILLDLDNRYVSIKLFYQVHIFKILCSLSCTQDQDWSKTQINKDNCLNNCMN